MADERLGAGHAQRLLPILGGLSRGRCGGASRLHSGAFPFRPLAAFRTGGSVCREAQTVDDAAQPFRHDLAHDLGNARPERNPAPLGIALGRVGPLVIRCHVLGAVAR